MTEPSVIRVNERCSFIGDRNRLLDTVVFVHGLTGDHLATWKKFPRLVKTDSELPALNVMCWGYRSYLFSPFVSDVRTLGKNLSAALNVQLDSDSKSYLVGHSMGGLVIFESLVGQCQRGRALEAPNKSVSQITLFASPVSGSNAAAIVENALGRLWFARRLVNRQVRSLARGENTNELLAEVHKRIYSPRSETSKARKIPIRMVMATRDRAVSKEDKDAFTAQFDKLVALELDYGHSSIKTPDSHLDERYRALANDLKGVIAMSFGELCRQWMTGSPDQRLDVDILFDRQYGRMVREYYIQAGGGPTRNWKLYERYIQLIKRDGARLSRPCHYTAERALMVLRRRGLLPNA